MNKEEAIDILENCIADYIISEYCEKCGDNKICNERNEDCYYQQAIDTVLNLIQKQEKIIDKLEDKLMYALSPTTHELAIITKENFKDIIRQNIDEDTYTIKQKLKEYWKGI